MYFIKQINNYNYHLSQYNFIILSKIKVIQYTPSIFEKKKGVCWIEKVYQLFVIKEKYIIKLIENRECIPIK